MPLQDATRPAPFGDSTARVMPIEDIWRALVNDQLVPWFQPIVDIDSRQVVAVEALARWQHPALGTLTPISFVPVMEERGMIRELTELILEKSLYACLDWQAAGQEVTVSINLTSLSLQDPNLCLRLEQQLQRLQLPTSRLTLEFSEATLRQHWEQAASQLEKLRSAGFGVAVDEFGIGLSLADKLTTQRVSALKLDRAFVQGVAGNQHLQAILADDIALAQKENLATIAIGVEDANDLATLGKLGCKAVQGYICSAPLPASGFSQWISEWEKR